jgi:quinol monooxygenase YgiN
MSHGLINRMITKPGARDRVVELMIESGKLFDDNAACLLYYVWESADDPNLIWVTDLWTSEEEHTAAMAQPEMRPYVDEAMPLLEGMPEQLPVQAVGGKGLQPG